MTKKRCDWRLFFSFLHPKKKMDNIFLTNKQQFGGKKAAARLATITATRFFLWTAFTNSIFLFVLVSAGVLTLTTKIGINLIVLCKCGREY